MRTCKGCGTGLPPSNGPRERMWCSDRCRKGQYVRECIDCGARLSGSDGNGPNAPVRCVACNGQLQGELRKVWDRPAIIAAIQRWVALHGEPPAVTTWCPTKAREIGKPELAMVDYSHGRACEWPHAHAVMRAFGTWNAGIAAAGFEPRPAHHVPRKAAA